MGSKSKKIGSTIIKVLTVIALLLSIFMGVWWVVGMVNDYRAKKGKEPIAKDFGNSLTSPAYETLKNTILSQIGIQEYTGKGESNPQVEKYFEEFGHDDKDDTPWCAAALNWILKKSGFVYAGKHNGLSSLRARHLEKIAGKEVSIDEAEPYKTIFVSWRNSKESGQGHCGFFVKKVGDKIYLAGGNQSDAFTDNYAVRTDRITRVFNPVVVANA